MFLVFTYTSTWPDTGTHIAQKMTGGTVILLAGSTLTAFLSMHVRGNLHVTFWRRASELLFLAALSLCLVVACLVVFDVVHLDR